MIKTKLILTAKATILVIDGLPEDVVKIKIENGHLWLRCEDDIKDNLIPWGNLLPGKWESVGFLKDIPESVAKELMDKVTFDKWVNYSAPNYWEYLFDTATESLRSLVAANCLLRNGYGEYPTKQNTGLDYGMEYLGEVDMWETEEETVFHNPFLLKKIN